ncbi:MAG: Hpt protein [Herbinix sp.]|jgi:HPt (histidine-containing phosphotransfer) domain-containing protein|nr:Hpt protein [Herbinix sp.]
MEQMCRKLKEHGIDIDGVIERLGGNKMLYLTICKKFVSDKSYPSIIEALAAGNLTEAHDHIHTLKGVAANLGFIYLYALCNRLLTELEQKELICFEQDIRKLIQECDFLISILS